MAPPGPPARVEDRDVIGFANKRVASSGPPAVRSFASTREGREERQQLQAQRGRGWYSHTSSNGTHRGGHGVREGMPAIGPSSRGKGGGSRAFNPPSGPRRDREVSSFAGGRDSWVSTEGEEEYEPRDRDRDRGGGRGAGGLPIRPSFERFGGGPREGEAGPSSWNQGGHRGGRMHRVYSPSQPTRNSDRSHSPVRQPNFSTQNGQSSSTSLGPRPSPVPSPAPTRPAATRPSSTHTHFSPHSPTLPAPADRSQPVKARQPPIPADPIRPTPSALPALATEQIPQAGPAQAARQAIQPTITSRESTPTIPTAKLKFKPTKKARIPSGPELSTQSDLSGTGVSLAVSSTTKKDELEEEVDTKPTMEELNAYEPMEIKIQRTGTLALMKKDIPRPCFSVPGKDRVLARQEFKAIHFAKLRTQGKTPKHAMWRDDGFAIDWVREDMEPSPPPAPAPKQAKGDAKKRKSSMSPTKLGPPSVPHTTVISGHTATNSTPGAGHPNLTSDKINLTRNKCPEPSLSQSHAASKEPPMHLPAASLPVAPANPFESWPAPTPSRKADDWSGINSSSLKSTGIEHRHAPTPTPGLDDVEWRSEADTTSTGHANNSSASTWFRYFPIPDDLRSQISYPLGKMSPDFVEWRRRMARIACEIDADDMATLKAEPIGGTKDQDMYKFRLRRFLPGEKRWLPKWLKTRKGEVVSSRDTGSPVKEEKFGMDAAANGGTSQKTAKSLKEKEHKRKNEDQVESQEAKKKKSSKVEGHGEKKKHIKDNVQTDVEKGKTKKKQVEGTPGASHISKSITTAQQPPALSGTATLAFPSSSTPTSSFAAFGSSSTFDKPSIPLTPGQSLFNHLPTDIKPTSTSVTSSATLDQLEDKLFANLESIDKWTQMMADYPSRGEYLQKQVERVQQDIFKIQEEIRRRKGGK